MSSPFETALTLAGLGLEVGPVENGRLLVDPSADPVCVRQTFEKHPAAKVGLLLRGDLCAVEAPLGVFARLAANGTILESSIELRTPDDTGLLLFRGRLARGARDDGIVLHAGRFVAVAGPVNITGDTLPDLPAFLSEPEADWDRVSNAAAGRVLRWRNAAEVFAESPAFVPWIAEPFVARGALTFIEGRPKAGKSTFALALCRAVLRGEEFLGRPTVRSSIVLLSEVGVFGLRLSLERAGIGPEDAIDVVTLADRNGANWSKVAAEAAGLAREKGALLVVDTLAPWAGVSDENDAGQAMLASRPLLEARDSGLGVFALRHERKTEGAPGEAGRGSSAYTGSADSIVSIRKAPDGPLTRRDLHFVSRLPLPFDSIAVDFDGGSFRVAADARKAPDLREAIEEELRRDPAASVRDLCKALKKRPATIAPLLRHLRPFPKVIP